MVDEPGVETIVVDNASRDGSRGCGRRAVSCCSADPLQASISASPAGVNRAAQLLMRRRAAGAEPGRASGAGRSRRAARRPGSPAARRARRPRAALPRRSTTGGAFRFPGLVQVALDLLPVDRLMDSRLNGRIHASAPHPIDHPLGACMLIRRAAWDDVGPLDEGYFMYMEEVDWCRRARARGWQVWHQPAAARHPPRRGVHPPAAGRDVRPAVAQPPPLLPPLPRPAYNRLVHCLVRLGLPPAAPRRFGSSPG